MLRLDRSRDIAMTFAVIVRHVNGNARQEREGF